MNERRSFSSRLERWLRRKLFGTEVTLSQATKRSDAAFDAMDRTLADVAGKVKFRRVADDE